jgi:hypothetical protein
LGDTGYVFGRGQPYGVDGLAGKAPTQKPDAAAFPHDAGFSVGRTGGADGVFSSGGHGEACGGAVEIKLKLRFNKIMHKTRHHTDTAEAAIQANFLALGW